MTIPLPEYRRELSSGTLTVTPTQATMPLASLFDIAERRNPKRAFLFVSKVLGRHIPVSPAVVRRACRQLAEQIPGTLPGPVLVIGMAETAVGLAAGVFQEARSRLDEPVFLTSTRHPMNGELLCEFKENHSHATDHLIYQPASATLRDRLRRARSIVLIDDEATTGNTFLNLLAALRASGVARLEHVVTVTLTDWSDGAIAARCPLPVHSVSLAAGRWRWSPRPDALLPAMPPYNLTARGKAAVASRQDWGRLGMDDTRCALGAHLHAAPGENVLVLGSSEFVWQPFLLAERLEAEGARVRFGSTTRSPIAQGHAIASVIAFTDNYGLGIANFLYNVAHQRFDRIILGVETAADTIDGALLAQLGALAPNVEVVTYE